MPHETLQTPKPGPCGRPQAWWDLTDVVSDPTTLIPPDYVGTGPHQT